MLWHKESNAAKDAIKAAALRPQWEFEREWHRWFAWHPVEVAEDRTAWLTTVERRLTGHDREEQPAWYNWGNRRYEYRLSA